MTALRILWRYTPLLVLAVLWQIATQGHVVSEDVLPPLSDVAASFADLLRSDLLPQLAHSAWRGAVGLIAAIVVGTTTGILMAWYRPLRLLVKPFVQLFYPIPKSALIPVTIMWIGLGDPSKITLIFVGSLLPVIVSAFNAARGVEHTLLWSARGMGANEREVLWDVVLPAALPDLLNGYRLALALSIMLVVAGEMIIANNGIGFLINFLGQGGDYAGMVAGIVTVTLVGFALDRAYLAVTRRILVWRE
jgi:NitT/TauT family transport system permease protein